MTDAYGGPLGQPDSGAAESVRVAARQWSGAAESVRGYPTMVGWLPKVFGIPDNGRVTAESVRVATRQWSDAAKRVNGRCKGILEPPSPLRP